MATNVFEATQYVLDDVFVRFWNSLAFARTANRNLEGDFKNLRFATGQTLNYRLEERYLGGEGATATDEARVQVVRPLTIDKQFHVMVDYTGFELTFNRARDEPYLEMANVPRAKRLGNQVEGFIANKFQGQIFQTVGTPGTPISVDTIFDGDALMTQLAIPEDGKRYCAVDPRVAANLSKNLYQVFNNTVNTGALIDGFIGHLSGFDFFKSNFLTRHIAGAGQVGGSPPAGFKLAGTVTNGPITGGNTIVVTGLGLAPGAIAFKAEDILQVDPAAGVYMVNPETYQPIYNAPAQFVVTTDVVTLDGSNATINVNPTIVISGARQNISMAIPNGTQMLMYQTSNRSIMYHTQAVVFAAPPIKELRGGVEAVTRYSDLYKLSMTYSLGADIRNYQQLDRIDVLSGCEINPEFAVLALS